MSTTSEPTRLSEFLPRYKANDNEWWSLSSGAMQNLFEEACDEADRLRLAVQDMANELLQVEAHCPCGARPESPATHPHVIGCPVQRALEIWCAVPSRPPKEP